MAMKDFISKFAENTKRVLEQMRIVDKAYNTADNSTLRFGPASLADNIKKQHEPEHISIAITPSRSGNDPVPVELVVNRAIHVIDMDKNTWGNAFYLDNNDTVQDEITGYGFNKLNFKVGDLSIVHCNGITVAGVFNTIKYEDDPADMFTYTMRNINKSFLSKQEQKIMDIYHIELAP